MTTGGDFEASIGETQFEIMPPKLDPGLDFGFGNPDVFDKVQQRRWYRPGLPLGPSNRQRREERGELIADDRARSWTSLKRDNGELSICTGSGYY